MNNSLLLEVKNLQVFFPVFGGVFQKKIAEVKAVDGVSFTINRGETFGLVGESGCGKTTVGRAIINVLTHVSPDVHIGGEILYHDKDGKVHDITNLSSSDMKKFRSKIQMIFQDPYSSLNPRIPIGKAIMEPMQVHQLYVNDKKRKEKTLEILKRVGLEEEHFNRYPHEFSGGQRQRIGIARTIALQPKLIVCDESVSALDISVQAQVLNLLNELKENFGFTYIFISHDLAVVKYMSDQVMVMNQCKIEEIADADDLYAHPKSAYTQKLIDAIPKG